MTSRLRPAPSLAWGFALLLLGLAVVPLWRWPVPGGLRGPYVVGLALVSAACLVFLVRIRRGLAGGGSPRRLNRALVGLALGALYLAVEVTASGIVLLKGENVALHDFRQRYLFRSLPHLVPHPFLLVMRNPEGGGINRLGFADRDWPTAKPAGTLRIACLGGSTTEDGYPPLLQARLRELVPESPVEVLSFGVASWTSAQSLTNYVLNVRYFAPDFVIVHHGANEQSVRGFTDFRRDYAHAFTPLRDPAPRPDAPLVASSNAYAYAKLLIYRRRELDPGVSLLSMIHKKRQDWAGFRDLEIDVFRDNLILLVDLAQRDGATAVLATQPYSQTRSWSGLWQRHMREVNQAVREVAAARGALLIDLAVLMSGHEDYFVDPIHLTRHEAVPRKAALIAERMVPLVRGATVSAAAPPGGG